jgi:hypothetical protein
MRAVPKTPSLLATSTVTVSVPSPLIQAHRLSNGDGLSQLTVSAEADAAPVAPAAVAIPPRSRRQEAGSLPWSSRLSSSTLPAGPCHTKTMADPAAGSKGTSPAPQRHPGHRVSAGSLANRPSEAKDVLGAIVGLGQLERIKNQLTFHDRHDVYDGSVLRHSNSHMPGFSACRGATPRAGCRQRRAIGVSCSPPPSCTRLCSRV